MGQVNRHQPSPVPIGRVLLTSASPGYNLGLAKLGAWLSAAGWDTVTNPLRNAVPPGFALYAFSAVFSWDLPALVQGVQSVPPGAEIWIGGPAPSAMPAWVEKQTGVVPTIGPDARFERQTGAFRWCRTTRGCPVGCYFCIVPKIDGVVIREYDDFVPAPVVVDDNLLRSSWRHQQLVVDKLEAAGFGSVDLNSGFEARLLEQRHVDLYGRLPLSRWRIAFDELKEWRSVRSAIQLLRANGIPSKHIPCYLLAGNEPFEHCLWRAERVVEWGGEPRIQMLKPLNWLQPRSSVWVNPRFDWTRDLAVNFPRYWYSYAWRRVGWAEWAAAGFRYQGDMTTQGLGRLRATRHSAATRWRATPDESGEAIRADDKPFVA